jgi:hypothetical protein
MGVNTSSSAAKKGQHLFADSFASNRDFIAHLEEHGVDDDDDDDLMSKTTPLPAGGKKVRGNWTAEQDEALRLAVEKHDGKKWRLIADEVPGGRTHIQCLQRWQKVLKPGLVKGPWKPEEDALLREFVPLEAKGNWDPSIRRDPWTAEEDELIIRLHAEFGNGWALISQQLPGRTENSVKSRFKSLERRQEKLQQQQQAVLEAKKKRKVVVSASAPKQTMAAAAAASLQTEKSSGVFASDHFSSFGSVLSNNSNNVLLRHLSSDQIYALSELGPDTIVTTANVAPIGAAATTTTTTTSSNSLDRWLALHPVSGISMDDILTSLPGGQFETMFDKDDDEDFRLV